MGVFSNVNDTLTCGLHCAGLAKRLPLLDMNLYEQVKEIMNQNSLDNLIPKQPKQR